MQLLEEDSTLARLKREKEILNDTVKYYSAAYSLKSAFNSSGSSAAEGGSEGSSSSGSKS